VFTSQCLNLELTTLCSLESVGTMAFDEASNFSFTPTFEHGSPWSLGHKISGSIHPNGEGLFLTTAVIRFTYTALLVIVSFILHFLYAGNLSQ